MKPDVASTARNVILSRIRAALRPQPAAPRSAESSWTAIPRMYRRSSDGSVSDLVRLLTDRLHDYDAQVLQSSWSTVTQAMARMLSARGTDKMLLSPGFPEDLLPKGFCFVRDDQLTAAQLDACGGVMTTCTLAIAETGTIVLQNAPGQGRRAASLVPDYHLCLVEAEHIVATVPEGIAALQATAMLPTTFISGPSATADIEMTRIKGVHGPRSLDVILIA